MSTLPKLVVGNIPVKTNRLRAIRELSLADSFIVSFTLHSSCYNNSLHYYFSVAAMHSVAAVVL